MSKAYRIFGSYILFEEIRHDVLGHLYRAAEVQPSGLGRRVWVRTLDGPAVPTEDVLAARETGDQIAALLKASNVVSDASFPVIDGVPTMVCSYVPSQSLGSLFEKARDEAFPVPVDNSLLILEKLALALSAGLAVEVGGSSLAHGFVHPSLIFVTHDGEAVVMGFGVADQLLGLLDDPEAAAAVQPYLAPEVLVSRTASKRGDVYSLGAILFELLTGSPLPADPEARATVLEDARLAEDDEPLPNDIKSLLARALAARADERFSSAADFKKELDKLLYGGAYSPTTFNLALFMDRLFRSEIEAEEKALLAEREVDPTEYLAPPSPVEPVVEPEEFETAAVEPTKPSGSLRGVWIGLAAVAVVAAAVAGTMLLQNRTRGPQLPPTPTAEEIAAQKQAEDERLQAMIQEMVQQRMAEKEAEIRAELTQRQEQIEELRRRLQASERRAAEGQLSAEERQRQQELQRQIAEAEEAQRQQEEALETERQQIADAEMSRLEEETTAVPDDPTPSAVAGGATVAVVSTPTPTPEPEPTPTPEPTAVPEPEPTRPPAVTENSFFEPPEVDTLPVVLREEQPVWPRIAFESRQRGMVIIQATVGADGRVEDARVLRADHDGFGIPEAAIDAVRKYRFKPATKDGVRVKTYATVTKRYNFRDR
jgi:TonB family protein